MSPHENVVALQTRQQRINAECVAMLRDFLALAEAGDIESVAIAALQPDGTAVTQASDGDHFPAMLGAVAILQHRMITECRRTV